MVRGAAARRRVVKRVQALALVGLALIAALVLWLARTADRPPPLPADPIHRDWDGADDCLDCHGPGRSAERRPDHPLGHDCRRCHFLEPSASDRGR